MRKKSPYSFDVIVSRIEKNTRFTKEEVTQILFALFSTKGLNEIAKKKENFHVQGLGFFRFNKARVKQRKKETIKERKRLEKVRLAYYKKVKRELNKK